MNGAKGADMKMLFLQRAQRLLIVGPMAVFFLFCAATARSQTNDYEFNDSHFHLTNNVQEGPRQLIENTVLSF